MEIINAKNKAQSQKTSILCYGPSGIGKTVLCATLGKAFIISIEGGTLSINGSDCDIVEARSMSDVEEAYGYFIEHQDEYSALCLDSITELCDLKLAEETKRVGKGFDRFNNTVADIQDLIRDAHSRPFDFYCTALVSRDKGQDRSDSTWQPKVIGQILPSWLTSHFDEVFTIVPGQDEEGNPVRLIQTRDLRDWELKDRSGKLDTYEPCDLEYIINKIRN